MSPEVAFSRPVKVETLPRDGLTQRLAANAAERAALAELNDLVEIAALTADFVVTRSGRGVRVEGAVHAEATQTCVVSLEPFPVVIDERVDVRFAHASEQRPRAEAETIALDVADPPDPIVDGKIDLGALAAEFMALALDPYPRKPGAEFTPPEPGDDGDSPFSALAKIVKPET
jgi:uncharacterized metal-binding protein YceD (DUF177 family)